MNNGYWQKLLRVNLTKEEIIEEDIPGNYCEKYLGGAGMAAKYIMDEVPAKVDPLSFENKLIFSTGPFQMSKLAGSGRWEVCSISPLTGIWGEANAGGFWGSKFKRTGYDLIIIEGSSKNPVYLMIDDDGYKLCDAEELWGKDIRETTELLQQEVGKDYSVLTIGQAGERLVPMACIASDDAEGIAGRTGMGAVMGSKKLKAVIVKGNKTKKAASEEFENITKELRQLLINSDFIEGFREHGQPGSVVDREKMGLLPIKNWKQGKWEEGAKKIGAPVYTEELKVKPSACAYCPIACGRRVEVNDGENYDHKGRGPEYETLGMMGSLLLIDDLKKISYANELCNRYGIDTISVGGVIAYLFECYEKGIINKDDLDGIEADWGNADALIELVKKIGLNEGIGSALAKGSKYMAEKIGEGSEAWAVHVKNMEVPAHDPRAFFSMAITYATSSRGACHMHGFAEQFELGLMIPEIGLTEGEDRFTNKRKGYAGVKYQDMAAIFNSIVQCMVIPFGGMSYTNQIDALNALNGWDVTPEELIKTGERINNLQHLINLKQGMHAEEITIPDRLLEPLEEGGTEGNVPDIKAQVEEYYQIRGWDSNAIPTDTKLEELGLEKYKDIV